MWYFLKFKMQDILDELAIMCTFLQYYMNASVESTTQAVSGRMFESF